MQINLITASLNSWLANIVVLRLNLSL